MSLDAESDSIPSLDLVGVLHNASGWPYVEMFDSKFPELADELFVETPLVLPYTEVDSATMQSWWPKHPFFVDYVELRSPSKMATVIDGNSVSRDDYSNADEVIRNALLGKAPSKEGLEAILVENYVSALRDSAMADQLADFVQKRSEAVVGAAHVNVAVLFGELRPDVPLQAHMVVPDLAVGPLKNKIQTAYQLSKGVAIDPRRPFSQDVLIGACIHAATRHRAIVGDYAEGYLFEPYTHDPLAEDVLAEVQALYQHSTSYFPLDGCVSTKSDSQPFALKLLSLLGEFVPIEKQLKGQGLSI